MTVKERIAALRARMKETGIDAYLIPTDDFHGSEYVGEYFKCRKYITGFTGSAGTAVIMQDMAGLWTDGRYFIQAADQLEGTGITLFKMGEPEVPTVHEFLKKNLTQGMCLGFDGRTVSAKEAAELEKMLDENGVSLSVDHDLAGDIWENRPVLSCELVRELDIKWTGESRADKCARIRKAMEKKGADLFVLTSLDDIAWLLNIRGGDIHCCPVVLSYLVMTKTEIRLFANKKAFQTDVLEALEKDGVTLFPYDSIYEYVKTFKKDKKVLLCKKKVNSRLVSNIPADTRILDEENLTLLPKATKNPVEVENERIAHIRDGVAVTKFIYWLKKNVGRIPITELSAAEKLYEFRSDCKESLKIMDRFFQSVVESYRTMGITVNVELLGLRPCTGNVDPAKQEKLIERCCEVMTYYTGEKEIATGCASTDCNIPLSQGIPAVCFGGYVGHKGHTRQEFVELDSLEVGPLVVGTVITEYFQ